jgi:hypothetical protein
MRHAALSCALALSACTERALGPLEPPSPPQAPVWHDPPAPSQAERLVRPVDLLFVVDDSGSMAPKQWALRQRFSQLVERLVAAPGDGFDLHIGVTTTDLGAPGISCGYRHGGALVRDGAASAHGCQPLADEQPFITYQTESGATNAMAGDVVEQFACLAAGGELGCGYEMPLESAYRVLTEDHSGFVRPDALLVLVLVTDEDDCSVDDPADDLFTNPAHGVLNSYRCARFGVVCDGQLLPERPDASFSSCRAATTDDGGKLAPLSKYQQLFYAPAEQGGIKADPRRVLVASLAAPPTPVRTEVAGTKELCGLENITCTVLSHSCQSGDHAGDPAVRLDELVSHGQDPVRGSICDDDYRGFFDALAHAIIAR